MTARPEHHTAPPATGADRLLAAARGALGPRPGPAALDALVADGALVVDIRPEADRRRHGELPGALVVERNVLEWRLDPTGAHRHPDAGAPDRVVVVVCNEGYASSLAAAALRDLGLPRATDLDGGYLAWAAYRSESARPSRMSDSDTSTSSSPSRR